MTGHLKTISSRCAYYNTIHITPAKFLDCKKYDFLLISRFTHDCLKKLLRVARAKQVIPTAVQFKNNLELICVSQYLKCMLKGSYNEEDFLNIIKERP